MSAIIEQLTGPEVGALRRLRDVSATQEVMLTGLNLVVDGEWTAQ